MYETYLDQIQQQSAKYDEQLQAPCPGVAWADLEQRASAELGVTPPPEYGRFLEHHDGLDWDGVVIYASRTADLEGFGDRHIEGLVEANLGHRDDAEMRKYLVFGETGVEIFVQELSSGAFQLRDRVSLDLIESVPTFEQLIKLALEEHV